MEASNAAKRTHIADDDSDSDGSQNIFVRRVPCVSFLEEKVDAMCWRLRSRGGFAGRVLGIPANRQWGIHLRVDEDCVFVIEGTRQPLGFCVANEAQMKYYLYAGTDAREIFIGKKQTKGMRSLQDICLDAVLSQTGCYRGVINQLPLPSSLIDQLNDKADDSFERAKELFDGWFAIPTCRRSPELQAELRRYENERRQRKRQLKIAKEEEEKQQRIAKKEEEKQQRIAIRIAKEEEEKQQRIATRIAMEEEERQLRIAIRIAQKEEEKKQKIGK